MPYRPHTFAGLLFEISSSIAHQNQHSTANKKWAGPTFIFYIPVMTLFATHEIGWQRHMTKWAAGIVIMFLFSCPFSKQLVLFQRIRNKVTIKNTHIE